MKTKIYPYLMVFTIIACIYSCKKDATSASNATKSTALSSSNGSIALAAVTSNAATKDSIYLVNCYPRNGKKDSVAFSALPTAITTYLTTNYSGYTFVKAYKTTDSLKVANGYVVIIKYNGNYIGLKFNSSGTFISVLEQKDGADINGNGWHEGGPFCDRDGKQRDTIALSAIPTAVSAYFAKAYPEDTLLHAYVTPDTTYVLISKDTVLYATDISATGSLIHRIKIEPHGGVNVSVLQSSLLSAISSYLTTTYPGYVFVKAYVEKDRSTVLEYHVFITANSTNYVIDFDANGTFVKTTVIH